jgi:hypothetical protein
MSVKRKLLFSLSAFIYLFVNTSVGLACTCEMPKPGVTLKQAVAQARDKAKAVFSGEVVEVIKNPQVFYIEVRFKVEHSWKQVRTNQLVIRTGRGGGDCGYRFEVGERYLVYAYGSDVPAFETNICQRTRKLTDAQDDLKLLGKSRIIKQNPQ